MKFKISLIIICCSLFAVAQSPLKTWESLKKQYGVSGSILLKSPRENIRDTDLLTFKKGDLVMENRQLPYLTWKAVSEGKLRLYNSLSQIWPNLDPALDSIRISHLLYHTSGLYGDGSLKEFQDQPKKFIKQATDISFEYANINHVLLKEVLKHYEIYPVDLEAKGPVYSVQGLLDQELSWLAGEGIHPLLASKVGEPKVRTNKIGKLKFYGSGWFIDSLFSESDSCLVYTYLHTEPDYQVFTSVIPSLDFALKIVSETKIPPEDCLKITNQLALLSFPQTIVYKTEESQDFIHILALLTALAISLLFLNLKKSSRKKTFRSGSNSIAILVLILCALLVTLYWLGYLA